MSPEGRLQSEPGQALIETVLMIWLFAILLSAIIQVFLVHNYSYQMANNAYYSLFKDKAYGEYNKSSKEFSGYPNWPRKPLRTVSPLEQAGGKVHVLAGGDVNWSEDDRAAIPMMPFFEDAIILELRNRGVNRAPVRLKLGNHEPGLNYMPMKFLWMAMGTEGGFSAFFEMIGSIIDISGELGQNYTDFTDGYDQGDVDDMYDDYGDADGDLNGQDQNGGQQAKDQWDNAHGDFNHDGYNDACEAVQGNNHPSCKNDRPWE
ncbi:MAG: hypothetical protein ACRD21_20760 [Vicinamibacteria bacterium]